MAGNEKGMSLIELLAALSLVSIITVLIWTTFSISSKQNILETNKMRLQQEANYIATGIQKLHRQCVEYDFIIESNRVLVDNCRTSGSSSEVSNKIILSDSYVYSYKKWVEDESGQLKLVTVDSSIEPLNVPIESREENLNVPELIVKNNSNDKIYVSVPLSISRVK